MSLNNLFGTTLLLLGLVQAMPVQASAGEVRWKIDLACNRGAMVIDRRTLNPGTRDEVHQVQLVVRDRGVVEYLVRHAPALSAQINFKGELISSIFQIPRHPELYFTGDLLPQNGNESTIAIRIEDLGGRAELILRSQPHTTGYYHPDARTMANWVFEFCGRF